MRANVSLFITMLIVAGCSKQNDSVDQSQTQLDTSQFKKLDSVPLVKKVKTALKDTVLTIRTDSVHALYYPNTGKRTMTLKKGDVCKITRTGRYDVVDSKGNFWIRVDRMGGRGWIFGGNTSIESDLWVFAEGMTEIGHPYNTYKINKISAPRFADFLTRLRKNIKKTEVSAEDEGGSRKVELISDGVIVRDDDGIGNITNETFTLGPATDSVQSINYSFSVDGEIKTSFNHTFITHHKGANVSILADFPGELKSIYQVGNTYVLMADYALSESNLGLVHYTNVGVWSTGEKTVKRFRYGHSAVDGTGLPIFKRWDDGSFVANATVTMTNDGQVLSMQIFEEYNRLNDDDTVTPKVFYITRYFTFNSGTRQFEESKQEVIYLPE